MPDVSPVMRSRDEIRPAVRVLYLVDDTDPGPIPDRLAKLLKRLRATQFVAAVCTVAPHGDHTEKIQSHDFPVVTLEAADASGPRAIARDLLAGLRLRNLLRKYQPDVLHVMGARSRIIGRLAAASIGVDVISSADVETPNRGFRGLAEGFLDSWLPEPLRVVESADAEAGTLALRSRRPQRVATLGVPVDIVAERTAPVVDFERLPNGLFYVGAVLGPGASDCTRRMLEAFRIFAASDERARLVVLARAGAAHLEPWARDLEIRDRIILFDPPRELARVLRRLQVLWVHGRPHPDERAILHGMCVGVPVVCDRSTSLAPAIDEIGGALMRDGTWPRQFAEATRELATNPELAQAVGRAGRLVVERGFSIADFAARLRDLYTDVAGPHPVSGGAAGSDPISVGI